MSLYDDVYGLTYKSAEEQMAILNRSVQDRCGKPFTSLAELKDWARDHLLDKVVYMRMDKSFMYVSHKGELLRSVSYEQYYSSVLSYFMQVGEQMKKVSWIPEGFEYLDKAYIAGEQSDGIHKPLYYRDYCVPSGYYSPEHDAFNVAKPFPVYAKETGRDTSHIYTYIEHVAGECAPWLLAWLRAKLLYPTVKTQVVPIIVSRTQGSGKTTFAEVICKGLFGKDNVLVSDQYDSSARFNADYADSLIVCLEEKEETDRRNSAGTLKSRATATTIRKEQKGVDPIYQDSYTDFIMTTNKDVPIKFDGREDQRRFMIMEADPDFTRKTSRLADEVFTKLYGYDADYNKRGVPFQDDADLIAQFKHELFTREDIAGVKLRQFPKTPAYRKCFTLPRTTEATEIESIMRSLAPFIKASLDTGAVAQQLDGEDLRNIVQIPAAVQFVPAFRDQVAFVALCRPLVFYDAGTNRPFQHSVVERSIYDCMPWLLAEYGIRVMSDMDPLLGGFTGVAGRYKMAPAAKFCLAEDAYSDPEPEYDPDPDPDPGPEAPKKTARYIPEREGQRLRINDSWRPDPSGVFETVNEMKPGVSTLKDKSRNVRYLDTFLLESDTPSAQQKEQEVLRAKEYTDIHGEGAVIKAETLYKERLKTALTESMRLFEAGTVCRIVYSGAKSYHLLIRVADAPQNIDEYKWLHAYLCTVVSDRLVFDESTADPARLTRAPVTALRMSSAYGLLVKGEQKPVAEDWGHVYGIQWREVYKAWLERPLSPYESRKGKPVMPTRPEYKEAMEAVLDGTFWTDPKWDGQRQTCFFAAYRLLRLMGYTHGELWEGGVMTKGVEAYKNPGEISYWRSRKDSALIGQIDSDIDEYLEEKENGGR